MFKHTMEFDISEKITIDGYRAEDSEHGYASIVVSIFDGYSLARTELTKYEARQLANVLKNAADYIERES